MGIIRGRVISQQSRNPVPRASISVLNGVPGAALLGAIGDDFGRFEIRNVPVGLRTVRVRGSGYQSMEQQVDVRVAQTAEVVVELMRDPTRLAEILTRARPKEREEFDLSGRHGGVSPRNAD